MGVAFVGFAREVDFMTKCLMFWVVLGGLVWALGGCTGDASMPDDVTKLQDQQRTRRGIPGPTEMPPGLGDDLPPPAATQPMTLQR